MITSIHQPSYFPWLGLLDKIKNSDVFVLLDITQLSDSGYQHRNIFLDNQNISNILTIPTEKKNYLEKTIKDLRITNNVWQKKHEKFIYFNYKKHDFFDDIYPLINVIYNKNHVFLIDALLHSMQITFDIFGLNTKIQIASELNLDLSLKKQDMVLHILKRLNASSYLSGIGAKIYQESDLFTQNKIRLYYQNFTHPVYPQKNALQFLPGLSCLDAAFNIGSEGCKKLI